MLVLGNTAIASSFGSQFRQAGTGKKLWQTEDQ
jgi:hypothetical protein